MLIADVSYLLNKLFIQRINVSIDYFSKSQVILQIRFVQHPAMDLKIYDWQEALTDIRNIRCNFQM